MVRFLRDVEALIPTEKPPLSVIAEMPFPPLPPLRVELSWPARELSPNARVHHHALARFKKAARTEANWATRFVRGIRYEPPATPVKIHIIAHPLPTGPHPDAQNLISSLKAHFDGIADAIGVNDRDFDAPTVEWADRCQRGKIIVVVG